MYARKWLSNEPEVLRSIPSSNCATEVDLDRGDLPQVKTLGVLWCPMEDQANWHAEKRDQTKRNFLKRIDPRPFWPVNAIHCPSQDPVARDVGHKCSEDDHAHFGGLISRGIWCSQLC